MICKIFMKRMNENRKRDLQYIKEEYCYFLFKKLIFLFTQITKIYKIAFIVYSIKA